MIYNNKKYVFYQTNIKEINETGRDILEFIRSSTPDSHIDDLISLLLSKYDVSRVELVEDVHDFIEDCIEKDIFINIDLLRASEWAIEDIHRKQEKIPELKISQFGYCVRLGDELTPGCQSCQRGKWAVLFVCPKCNLDCDFCPYLFHSKTCFNVLDDCEDCELISFLDYVFPSFNELKFQFSLMKDEFDAFAWIGGEPMMPSVLKKILPQIDYFHKAYPDYHQWLYTNGLYATEENMKKLFEVGIRELRFNLAATNYDVKIISYMKEAKKIFPYVCLEIPMLKATYEGLMSNIEAILETGLDQMNLAEFIVGKKHFSEPGNLEEEGKLYNYRGYITSPVSSRRYTYKVIERAVKEGWNVVINDCSNEYKHYKLAIQANKGVNMFKGRKNYWDNNYNLSKVDDWNGKYFS